MEPVHSHKSGVALGQTPEKNVPTTVANGGWRKMRMYQPPTREQSISFRGNSVWYKIWLHTRHSKVYLS